MKPASWSICVAVVLAAFASQAQAQVTVKAEDFTGTTSNNSWYFFNGACLTASTDNAGGNPGTIPGCKTIESSYYKEKLVGGKNGDNTGNSTMPDPNGSGALRLTNGSPGGYHQNGAVVSASPFPTGQGIQITFKTVTYRGDSKGAGKDGADGISFYLMDASRPAGIGAWGGSLGYSCSNTNVPYDGLVGAYLGLGIDEYGNFLNGKFLVPGYAGVNSATNDNAAYGYGYKPGRIGMRGAGSISFAELSSTLTGYGSNPGSASKPYYPASLGSGSTACPAGDTYDPIANTCTMPTCSPGSGSYSPSHNKCAVCPQPTTETYDPTTDLCGSCTANGGTYDTTSHKCINVCTAYPGTTADSSGMCSPICTAGTYSSTPKKCVNICPTSGTGNWLIAASGTFSGQCLQCNAGDTASGSSCKKSNGTTYPPLSHQNTSSAPFTTAASSSATAATEAPSAYNNTDTETTYAQRAVKNTCSSGHLWNYGTDPNNPTDAGEAKLSNPVNTKGILDYYPIPNGYTELSTLPTPLTIATENAVKRDDATPIFYNLKITQDGLVSLSYSVSGGSYVSVIKNQDMTASNGPVPTNVFFGLAGSTGGSNNIHEIMCFKAAPSTQAGSSTSVNEKLAAKVEAGTQAYFAFYDQNSWTGAVTANDLIDTAGVVSVATVANWDASCVLTGTNGTSGCLTTAQSGPTSPQSSRVIITCAGNCSGTTGNKGVALQYSNLSGGQQTALNDDANGVDRVSYLRGDRTNEINTVGVGKFRNRDSVLGDIVDSSPIWVGGPSNPYTASWSDRLPNGASPVDPMPENTATQSYQQFITAKQTRLNVVYGGSNDGLVHGFRSGSFDANGNFVNNTTTPNDGKEVLAYMPGAVVRTIHSTIDSTLDFSSPQYGHNFFVDATPTADDLFYNGTWHTWLVGGLGAGGAAIYALDITDPSSFSEANAATIVIGEWRATTISCSTPGGSTCGANLGNTYGTPQIRRLHNGKWGVIFGNGLGSSTSDGGIYIMTIDPSTLAKTFYYLSTGTSGGADNGISFVAPVDLDGDHITDYVYAGDLQGNVWKFDITSTDPANWAANAAPLFTTASGQPITTKVQPVITMLPGMSVPQVMIEFGTGQKTLLTNSSPTSYSTGTQALYGIWDWNFSNWNSKSTVQFRSLTVGASGLSSPYTLVQSKLQAQTFTASTTSVGNITGTNNTVCWKGTTTCTPTNNAFGWYANMQVASGLSEQVVFNPVFFQGAFIINSTSPANNVPTSCSVLQDTGFTYVVSATTGGVFSGAFPGYTDTSLAGIGTSATGTPYVVGTVEGKTNIVYQTVSGTPGAKQINVPTNTKAKRLTWVELR